jgi:Na+/glutamate symporter
MEVVITWNAKIAKPTSVGNALKYLLNLMNVMTIWQSIVEVYLMLTLLIDPIHLLFESWRLLLLDFIR